MMRSRMVLLGALAAAMVLLGAGQVGQTLATKLRELGHDVTLGTRNPRVGAVSYADAAGWPSC